MAQVLLAILIASLLAVAHSSIPSACFNLQPFYIELSSKVPPMLQKIQETRVPNKGEYLDVGRTAGIDLQTLEQLRNQWLHEFNWETEQAYLNMFKHFTAEIEGLTIHFIHEKSGYPDAIPLILNHGWPGSFLEFLPIAKNLTERTNASNGRAVSYDVIIPSIPGFGFSSMPPANWTTVDTARIYSILMTKVLGYDTFAVHGTDWGSSISYILYDAYNATARAAHFSFLPLFALTPSQLLDINITLDTDLERFEGERYVEWSNTGEGFFAEQSTKPNTLGFALQDHPMGQLAWIGEKLIDWSDPRAGTAPSVLTTNEILRSVSLYYLTGTFTSSLYIYHQNPHGFGTEYIKARTDAPMLFSAFKYNVAFWPQKLVAKVGNLVYYRNHDFGGHFSGVDNPPALLQDLREIGAYFK
ncbi:Alpha/Beta hydrolase protein [Stachybotrys elegans]|uniref:Alpha/Beta hydrolase protein n=1 Tax=Stachybotrys elegans TaxID=80388 RepID=A0A8K0SQ70_9HYPO|nr:Alpha/Beta hydrolase protein [Stachybotrys elegans]